jgi:uncharacterized protein (TIGR00369 family)
MILADAVKGRQMDVIKSEYVVHDPDYRQRIQDSFDRQGFMALIGGELTHLEPGICEVAVNYRPDLAQQKGFFHGGVIGTLGDTACGYAAYSLMAAEDSLLTVEYKLNIMGPGDGERLSARATVVRAGARLTICEGRVYNEKGGIKKECGLITATMMRLPDTSDMPD